jgi:cytochrome b involved in lipid metabolism
MNRLAYTAFVAFWASLATLLAVALLSDRPAAGPETPADEPLPVVSLEELARHDGPESCWKAIHGKVYDVTDFIDAHPTPAAVMLEWCGRESTEAWETKGYGPPHSELADSMLEDYLVGRLAAE